MGGLTRVDHVSLMLFSWVQLWLKCLIFLLWTIASSHLLSVLSSWKKLHLVFKLRWIQTVPTVSQLAHPSLGWHTIGLRYSHFHMEFFRQLTVLPKCTSNSIKNDLCIFEKIKNDLYKMAYTENGNFKHHGDQSIYITELLFVHMFDCDVTVIPCEGAVYECDQYLKCVFCCDNK